MRKITAFLLFLTMLLGGIVPSSAKSIVTDEFSVLNNAGLVPRTVMANDLDGAITRLEFSQLLMPLYRRISGISQVEIGALPYDDCDDASAAEAYSLGILATAGEGIFDPTGHVSRQDMAVALISTLQAAGLSTAINTEDIAAICGFVDFAEADVWAYNGLVRAVASEYISGISLGELMPHADATRQQAILAVSRVYSDYLDEDLSLSVPTIKPIADTVTGSFSVNWEKLDSATRYHIIVKDITKNSVIELSTTGTSVLINTDYFVDGEGYTLIVGAEYEEGICWAEAISLTYEKPRTLAAQASAELAAKRSRIFDGGNQYQTAEEAAANMVRISVPVWRLGTNGEKYSDKCTMTVNKNLADDILAIFTEIYNDESKFPIKDLGCYNWRNTIGGAQSQHSFGSCIDINSNENYYISASGNILSGSLWQPKENPYSITPDGIVVKTFAKYGWLWGGDAWGEGYAKDYMHFTYLGG